MLRRGVHDRVRVAAHQIQVAVLRLERVEVALQLGLFAVCGGLRAVPKGRMARRSCQRAASLHNWPQIKQCTHPLPCALGDAQPLRVAEDGFRDAQE